VLVTFSVKTTSTSPGWAIAMARCSHRFSPGGECTVNAGPAIENDGCIGLIAEASAPILPAAFVQRRSAERGRALQPAPGRDVRNRA